MTLHIRCFALATLVAGSLSASVYDNRQSLFASLLEPAPPEDSTQSFCRDGGPCEREGAPAGCKNVVCQLTMGRVEMHVPLKKTPHHTLINQMINVTTRGYNTNTPMGPTIKVRPGDNLKVTRPPSLYTVTCLPAILSASGVARVRRSRSSIT